MRPTITNAFQIASPNSQDRILRSGRTRAQADSSPASGAEGTLGMSYFPHNPVNDSSGQAPENEPGKGRNPRRSLASSLAAMQADLAEAEFGWSLELSPMQATDALAVFTRLIQPADDVKYLVNMEQSAWRDGDAHTAAATIAARLAIPVIEQHGHDVLVLAAEPLMQLASLCQPSRLLAVAVQGDIDPRDVQAMNKAIEAGRSPLLAELRAVAALEVLGDRSIVLHCRERWNALALVAENLRHYLSALRDRPASSFTAPELWQLERLLANSGAITIRPIETQVFSSSIDVGVNTSRERFNQPADRSLIYDIPSNTWHDEP